MSVRTRVDTPYRNSWADLMLRRILFMSTRPGDLHPTHQEEQKFMDARRKQ